eukprot:TRINITY_DN7701_c0_g1_i1.p2 TRINITY_DN7701_c0_g1~~TRINITY_DN7701_c0_g1_i1.p2  ORF type:complete len:104 (-),score=3.45 TRINITY_DN7701_c0_g1_i1:514-825(-)
MAPAVTRSMVAQHVPSAGPLHTTTWVRLHDMWQLTMRDWICAIQPTHVTQLHVLARLLASLLKHTHTCLLCTEHVPAQQCALLRLTAKYALACRQYMVMRHTI